MNMGIFYRRLGIFIQINMPFYTKTACASVWRCPSSIDIFIHINMLFYTKNSASNVFTPATAGPGGGNLADGKTSDIVNQSSRNSRTQLQWLTLKREGGCMVFFVYLFSDIHTYVCCVGTVA